MVQSRHVLLMAMWFNENNIAKILRNNDRPKDHLQKMKNAITLKVTRSSSYLLREHRQRLQSSNLEGMLLGAMDIISHFHITIILHKSSTSMSLHYPITLDFLLLHLENL